MGTNSKWTILGVRCRGKSSTDLIFPARPSGSECEYITGKGQNSLEAFANGDRLLVTNYSWNLGDFVSYSSLCFHLLHCVILNTRFSTT